MGFDTADQPIMTYQEVLKSKFENCQLKFIERENKVREKVFERVEAADAEHQKIEQEVCQLDLIIKKRIILYVIFIFVMIIITCLNIDILNCFFAVD